MWCTSVRLRSHLMFQPINHKLYVIFITAGHLPKYTINYLVSIYFTIERKSTCRGWFNKSSQWTFDNFFCQFYIIITWKYIYYSREHLNKTPCCCFQGSSDIQEFLKGRAKQKKEEANRPLQLHTALYLLNPAYFWVSQSNLDPSHNYTMHTYYESLGYTSHHGR